MSLEFEWDEQKSRANERKHGVSFFDAAEVFGDDLSACVSDPDHSQAEARFLLFGQSRAGRHLVVSYTERDNRIRIISARPMTRRERKAMSHEDTMRDEYPADLIRSGQRGKYAGRYDEGTNLVLLDPELQRLFPDSDAVNNALRQYARAHHLGSS